MRNALQQQTQYKLFSAKDLITYYDHLRMWLVEHQAESGTLNMLDLNGQTYDPGEYGRQLARLEGIEDEMNSRGMLYHLDDDRLLQVLERECGIVGEIVRE
jgi:hypothetical protein